MFHFFLRSIFQKQPFEQTEKINIFQYVICDVIDIRTIYDSFKQIY